MNAETKITAENKDFEVALNLVETKIKELRNYTPDIAYDKDKLAEVEINKFFFN